MLSKTVEQTFEGFGSFVTQLAFAWIYSPTPSLSEGASVEGTHSLPDGVVTLLEQAKWLGFAFAILSLLILAGRMVLAQRRGEGAILIGKFFWILAGIGLIAGAGGIVAHLVQDGEISRGAGAAVGFVQAQLFPWMAGLAMLGVIVGGAKLLWTQRGEDGRAVLGTLAQLVVVSAACVVVTNVLIVAFDDFSVGVLEAATKCDFATTEDSVAGKCFGGALTTMVLGSTTAAAAAGPAMSVWGPLIALVVIVVIVLLTVCQFVLIVFRSAVIILMVGVLPTSAAFSNMETGRQWFKRIIAWLLAALLYKPVAALIIATGIRIGSTVPTGIEDLVWNMLMGGAILTLSVVALPALMKLLVPAVASAAGSSGGTMMGAMAGSAIANGAIDLASASMKNSSNWSSTSTATHSSSASNPPGADLTAHSGPSGPGGQAASAKTANAGAQASTAAGGGTAGAAASGASAGTAASGAGAAAGAAGGPVGLAVTAGAMAAKRAGDGVYRGVANGASASLGDPDEK